MKRFFRHIFKFIMVVIILFISGILILIGSILITNNSARQMQIKQLEVIDKAFNTPRNPTPLTATDEILLPEYVGSFRRDSINRHAASCYEWHFNGIDLCSSAIYESLTSVDGKARVLGVRVEMRRKTIQSPQDINDVLGQNPCEAELGGEIRLRAESNVPYAYRECSGFFTGTPSLNGILWQNNDWTIAIEGSYEAFSTFITVYPF